jgi:hypothetical protein
MNPLDTSSSSLRPASPYLRRLFIQHACTLKSSNHSIGERRTGGDWPYTLKDWAENGVDAVEGRNWALTRTMSSDMTDGIARMAFVPAHERLKRREKCCFMLAYRPLFPYCFMWWAA